MEYKIFLTFVVLALFLTGLVKFLDEFDVSDKVKGVLCVLWAASIIGVVISSLAHIWTF